MNVQIIENESLFQYADPENYEVWLLNRTTESKLDSRIINIAEVTESLLPNTHKLPKLMTYIVEAHPKEPLTYESYEVITDNKKSYMIHAYICDEQCIKVIN